MNHLKIFLLVCLTILVSKVGSKNLNGKIYSNTTFTQYLGKFSFKDNGGYIMADINWSRYNIDSARFLLFSDSIEKVESLSCNDTVTPSYVFNKYSNPSYPYQLKGKSEWHLVIQNCEKYPSNLKYDIDLINEGDSFHSELNGMVIEGLLVVMLLSFMSILSYLINWCFIVFEFPSFSFFFEIGNWVYILSKNLFFLLLIYAGQGWTTSIYLESNVRDCINLLLIVFNILFGWSLSYLNDFSKPDIKPCNYYLDCLPGYLSYIVNVLLTVYFIYCNIISYRSLNDDEQTAKTALKVFTSVFSIYLLSPILVGIVVHFAEDQMKFQVSTIMNYDLDYIFYITLLIFFRPTGGVLLIVKLVNFENIDLSEF
ncbi:hypothetical protein ACTFIW_002782 [Dictyostelium discoideum]